MDPKLCLVAEKVGQLKFYNFGFFFFGSTKRQKRKEKRAMFAKVAVFPCGHGEKFEMLNMV